MVEKVEKKEKAGLKEKEERKESPSEEKKVEKEAPAQVKAEKASEKETPAQTPAETVPAAAKEAPAQTPVKARSKKFDDALKDVMEMNPDERLDFGIELIKGLSVLEVSRWVKSLEEEFGVSAQAVVAGVPAAGAGGASAEEPEAKTSFDVILVSSGEKKIHVIKEIRSITGLGLREAKTLVDEAPKPVKEGLPEEEANEIKAKLEAVGAKVEVK